MNFLEKLLRRHSESMHPVMRFDPLSDPVALIDLTAGNQALASIDVDDEEAFTGFISDFISSQKALYGAGGYGEHRAIYQRSEVFEGDRCIHLGVDLWANAGEEVYSPLDAQVHSVQNNDNHGDYGPTIILQHTLEETDFFTLYGHLSRSSLAGKEAGQTVKKGERIGWLGEYNENVHWPPHLHFQVIADMGDRKGDYPGVARPSEAKHYLALCPDPNLILKIAGLNNHEVFPAE